MSLLQISPEHVLDPVGRVEHADHGPFTHPLERGEEHVLALPIDVVRLLEKRPVVDHPFVQSPGVLGETQRREFPELLREVGSVVVGMGDRHGGAVGIEVDRREIQRNVLARLREQHAADPTHLDAGCGPEGQIDPVAQGTSPQLERRTVDFNPGTFV